MGSSHHGERPAHTQGDALVLGAPAVTFWAKGLVASLAAVALVVVVEVAAAPADRAAAASGCSDVSLQTGSRQVGAYARAGRYPTTQANRADGLPARVSVRIPRIRFTGPGRSATLPVGPCQHIYRFKFEKVRAPGGDVASPFRYLEIDWNTEGRPRGPNNSFSSPHFDFHYYRRPRHVVDMETMCESSNGKTCDPFKTGYAQMRRFLKMPAPAFVPASYAPDTGSSISMMGLHLLDRTFDYTVRNVDHHPTLIYGTFDGKVLFAEASVTLATLQDAIAAPDHAVSFRFRQPRRVQGGVPWPTRFTIRHLPDGTFRAGFERFRARALLPAWQRLPGASAEPGWPP